MRFDFVHQNCNVGCRCRFLLRVLLLNWELVQHNNILSRALSFNRVRPSSWWGHARWNLNVERLPVGEVFCSGFAVMETQNSYKGHWSACVFEISGMLKMRKVQGFEKYWKVFTKSRSEDSFGSLLSNMEGCKKQTIQAVHGSPSFSNRYVIDFLPSHKKKKYDPFSRVLWNNCYSK